MRSAEVAALNIFYRPPNKSAIEMFVIKLYYRYIKYYKTERGFCSAIRMPLIFTTFIFPFNIYEAVSKGISPLNIGTRKRHYCRLQNKWSLTRLPVKYGAKYYHRPEEAVEKRSAMECAVKLKGFGG